MASWLLVLIVTISLGTALNVMLELDPFLSGEGSTLWQRLKNQRLRKCIGPYALFAFPGLAAALLVGVMDQWAAILVTTLLIGTGFLFAPEVAHDRSIGEMGASLREDGPLMVFALYLVVSVIALTYVVLLRWLS